MSNAPHLSQMSFGPVLLVCKHRIESHDFFIVIGYNWYWMSLFESPATELLKIWKERVFSVMKVVFPLVLLALAVLEIQKMAQGTDVHILRTEMGLIKPIHLAIIIAVSFCAIAPMLYYDVILVKVLGIKMKTKTLVRNSFIVNTFSNLIGFGGLIGVVLKGELFLFKI